MCKLQGVTRGQATNPKTNQLIGTWSYHVQVSWNAETKLTLNIRAI